MPEPAQAGAVTRLSLHGGPRPQYVGFVEAGAVVSVAGGPFTEAQIVAGGQTIVLTVVNDTWVATVGADNPITDALILGLDSDGAEATGWDAVVKAGLAFGDVTRDSSTQVTILLPAFLTYDITANETITVTVPATALTKAVETVSSDTISVTFVAVVDDAGAGGGRKKGKRQYPRWIWVDGKRYKVQSPADERRLLAILHSEMEAEAQAVELAEETAPTRRRVRQKVRRVERQIAAVEQHWESVLDDEDEDLITILLH